MGVTEPGSPRRILCDDRPAARAGFTLFEVGLSLLLVSFGVVSVMLTIPTGLKVQQTARFSLLASAKAMELIESFSGKIGGERIAEYETPEPWEARPFCYSGTRWDLECRASRWDSGIIPLPTDIAQRLDSDGDEIQELLAAGAYLYYADPRALPGVDRRFTNPDAPNESQKLIFAISGYAQNNAIPVFPWKAWPYRAAYPSPPLYAAMIPSQQMAPLVVSRRLQSDGSSWNSFEGWCNGTPDPSAPSDRDPLMNQIFQAVATYYDTLKNGDLSYVERTTDVDPIRAVRVPLVDAVVAFCSNKFTAGPIGTGVAGMAPADEYEAYFRPADTSDFVALGKQYDNAFMALCRQAEQLPGTAYDATKAKLRAEIALRVQCMRFMSFVAGTFYLKRQGEAEPNLALFKIDNIALSVDRLRYFHDRCQQFAMRYAATCTYDWGAPRPVTRCIMVDNPLIEFDLFSAPRSGTISGSSVQGSMWKPVAAQKVTSIGLPAVFPGVLTATGWSSNASPFSSGDNRGPGQPFWGDADHFTLTRPFAPAERCRQLVFWSVDWQAYEDAETAPSAPLDASRCPVEGVHMGNLGSYDNRLNIGLGTEDAFYLRNPERELLFIHDMAARSTGESVLNDVLAKTGSDGGSGNRPVLLGRYGADRNHNYLLDRGPLPRSVRQRAQTVGRFQFYDPRIPVTLR